MSGRPLFGPSKVPSDGIQDAEFVEIDEAGQPTSPNGPVPPKRPFGCMKIGAICAAVVSALFILLIIFAASVGPPSETPAMLNNNADQVADDAADAIDQAATEMEDGPSLISLLEANDQTACSHPDTIATIRDYLLPKLRDGDLTKEEFARALAMARTDMANITASGIRAEVHEVSCDANLQYGEVAQIAFPISFKIRPPADPTKPPVFYIKAPQDATFWIMAAPITSVRSERPSPAEANPEAVSKTPTSAPQRDGQGNTITDGALFAPH